jgi:hypothetical protein
MNLYNDKIYFLLKSRDGVENIRTIRKFLESKKIEYYFTDDQFIFTHECEACINLCQDGKDYYIELHVNDFDYNYLIQLNDYFNLDGEEWVVKKMLVKYKIQEQKDHMSAGLFYTDQDDADILINYFIQKYDAKIKIDPSVILMVKNVHISILENDGFFMLHIYGFNLLDVYEFMNNLEKYIINL